MDGRFFSLCFSLLIERVKITLVDALSSSSFYGRDLPKTGEKLTIIKPNINFMDHLLYRFVPVRFSIF